MPTAQWGLTIAGLLLVLAVPVQAECLGPDCYVPLAMLSVGFIGYGILALVVLVMLVRPEWRSAGLWTLGIAMVLAIGVPVVSQGWQFWKLVAMERREVVGEPPAMTGTTPLLIILDPDCYYDACGALLRGRGNSGAYVLPTKAVEALDLTKPLRLAEVPLQQWAAAVADGSPLRRRALSPAERKAVAPKIDYLILIAQPLSSSSPGAFEAALRANPALRGMGEGEIIHVAMAPLLAGTGVLSLAELRFDMLDLSLAYRAFAVPLAPYNWHDATNANAGSDVVAQAFCPTPDGQGDQFCRESLK